MNLLAGWSGACGAVDGGGGEWCFGWCQPDAFDCDEELAFWCLNGDSSKENGGRFCFKCTICKLLPESKLPVTSTHNPGNKRTSFSFP